MARNRYHFLHIYQPGEPGWPAESQALGFQPRVDMYRDAQQILVQVEAPGVDEESLRLHFEPGQLVIEGRRDRPQLPASACCLCVEIEYGAFRRAIALPADADADSIQARYQAGILIIAVPLRRATSPSPVRVNID
ncbi:MAG: hypothetical protein JWN98_893 [Abditibacteriota bacterium]|nr:hypothetical protein [Abditibacteriota bacterium]